VRQLAWLHATPKPPEGTKRAKLGTASKLSRIDQMKRDKIVPQMPPNPLPHLTGWLLEIGLVEGGGMAAVPISWREIDAWCVRTRLNLSAWEARLLRRLSTEYVAEGRRAESETAPPPWRTAPTRRELEVEEAKLRRLLG
jgi:hypothetical protein